MYLVQGHIFLLSLPYFPFCFSVPYFFFFKLYTICECLIDKFKVQLTFLWGKFWPYYHFSIGSFCGIRGISPCFMGKFLDTKFQVCICYLQVYIIYTNTLAHTETYRHKDRLFHFFFSQVKEIGSCRAVYSAKTFFYLDSLADYFLHLECLCAFFSFISYFSVMISKV